MKPLSPVSAREAVHLLILCELAGVSADTLWVLKGGVNLRLFFKSPRYSQDMDLDGDSAGAGASAIRACLKGIFASRTFLSRLHEMGIRGLDPGEGPNKDTDTTFRYKFRIIMPGDVHLPTKVEVSFRGGHDEDPLELAAPDPQITGSYDINPIVVRHYTRPGATRQKIGALAGRAHVQARDVFDLHVLLRATPQEDLVSRLADTLGAQELRLAYDRALEITFEEYQGQVLEFLEGESADRYGTESAWDEIRLQAASLLERVMEQQEKPK